MDHAKEIAGRHLAKPLPRRWHHVQAVGGKAERIGSVLLDGGDVQILAAAAWLHDIGYAPVTTGPDGQDVDVPARLGEIRTRYGPDHVVTRFILSAEPQLVAATRRTEERLNAATQPI